VFPRDSRGRKRIARDTDTFKLSSSSTRRARDRLRKMGETIDKQALDELKEAAEVAVMREELGKAYQAYNKLIETAEDIGAKRFAVQYAGKARAAQKKLLSGPTKMLDAVDKLLKDKKVEEADGKLKEVEEQYSDLLRLSPELLERFQQLGGTPAFAIEAREREVRKKIRAGDAALARKDYGAAHRHYSQAATSFAGTKGAKVAADKLAQMFGDPQIRQAMKDQEVEAKCKLLLARARALLRLDRLAEARAACEKIVVDHADSKWAKDAVEVLDAIEQKERQGPE